MDILVLSNETLESKVQVLETLVTEEESKLKEVSLELERTQKSFKMLNSGTSKLEHILTIGKPSRDQRGLGFVGETSGSKTMFVKGFDSQNVATLVSSMKINVATNRKTVSNFDSKDKKFILICHFCGVKEHIRPRCFTMMSFVKNHSMIPFQRKTPRPKIELKNKQRKIWVKKSNINCFVSFTFLRTCATNSWYFDSGCSRHMIGS